MRRRKEQRRQKERRWIKEAVDKEAVDEEAVDKEAVDEEAIPPLYLPPLYLPPPDRPPPYPSLRSGQALPPYRLPAEIRARGGAYTRSPATTATGASAPCHHGTASCWRRLIGRVRARRGASTRRNHSDGLPG